MKSIVSFWIIALTGWIFLSNTYPVERYENYACQAAHTHTSEPQTRAGPLPFFPSLILCQVFYIAARLQVQVAAGLRVQVAAKGWSKKNSTKLRLWLNKGGGVRRRRIFLYEEEKKDCRLSHFSIEGGGPGNIFGLNICKLKKILNIIILELRGLLAHLF